MEPECHFIGFHGFRQSVSDVYPPSLSLWRTEEVQTIQGASACMSGCRHAEAKGLHCRHFTGLSAFAVAMADGGGPDDTRREHLYVWRQAFALSESSAFRRNRLWWSASKMLSTYIRTRQAFFTFHFSLFIFHFLFFPLCFPRPKA